MAYAIQLHISEPNLRGFLEAVHGATLDINHNHARGPDLLCGEFRFTSGRGQIAGFIAQHPSSDIISLKPALISFCFPWFCFCLFLLCFRIYDLLACLPLRAALF
jgi:hypothetical protein